MPTYDYACSACGHQFELEQRITEAPAKKCPKCGKQKAQRQISSGGRNFILKGGGWYSDLYSSPSSIPPKGDSSASSDASTKAESKAESTAVESKSESKPKTESKPKAESKPKKNASS